MKIIITELDKKQNKSELFPKINLEVVSRSGLHRTEYNLIEQDIKEKDLAHTLFINNRTGVLPIYLAKSYPQTSINILNIDYHYFKHVEQNIINNHSHINNICASNYQPDSKLSQIFLQIDSKTFSKEFYLDIFTKHYRMLKNKGKVFIASDKRVKWFEDFLRSNSISYTLEMINKQENIIVLRKSLDLDNSINFDDSYKLALPDKAELTFYSVPGVFSHHRIDEGALALIDTVEVKKSDTLIDMGSGIGTVGIALSKFNCLERTIFVDSNVRALDCARENAKLNKLSNCDFFLSDDGLQKSKASLFVGNPPYFSNFRIADLFIDNAYDNLRKGGRAYIVAKNIKHIHRAMLKVFDNATITSRRGYSVIMSNKL